MRLFKDRSITADGLKLKRLPILGYSWYWGGLSLWLRSIWLMGVWLIPLGAGIYTLYYYTNWVLAPSDVPLPPRLILLVAFWALAIGGSVWAWRERAHFIGDNTRGAVSEDERQHLQTATAKAIPAVRLILPFIASFLIVPCLLLMYRVWRWRWAVIAELRAEIRAMRALGRR